MTDRTHTLGTIAASLAALSTAAAVHANNNRVVVYIDAAAPAGGDGTTWSKAYNDLQTALLLVERRNSPPDWYAEFRIAQGRYTAEFGTGNPQFPFFVEQGDRLLGGYAGVAHADPDLLDPKLYPTVLSGDLAMDDNLWLNRSDNTLTLVRVIPYEISTTSAQSISTLFRNLTLESAGNDSYLTTELIQSQTPISMYGCTIRNNRAQAVSYASSASLTCCDIENNITSDRLFYNISRLINCRVQGNSVGDGRSNIKDMLTASQRDIDCTISGCLIADNRGYVSIVFSPSIFTNLRIDRSTFVNNTTRGSTVRMNGPFTRVSNCIFSSNTTDGYATIQVPSCDPNILQGQNVFDQVNIKNAQGQSCALAHSPDINRDPFVRRLSPNSNPEYWRTSDYRPRPTSPAIDRADLSDSVSPNFGRYTMDGVQPFDVPNVDNAGLGRSTYADIGAIEYIPTITCPADFNNSGLVNTQDIFDYITAWFSGCP